MGWPAPCLEATVNGRKKSFCDFQTLERQLHREALEVEWAEADRHIALSDGGAGLEQLVKTHFLKVVCILDFHHAKDHLVELSQAMYGEDESSRQTWLDDENAIG